MKKNVFKIVFIVIAAIAILVVVIGITSVNSGEPDAGIYKITDYKEYPDAYIKVKEHSLQFYNIDLNAIYQEKQIEEYNKLIDKFPDYALSDKEVEEYSDLNAILVEKPYYVDYKLLEEDAKTGTFEYTYFIYAGDNNASFGLVLLYDSFHKTIHINNAIQEITFKK